MTRRSLPFVMGYPVVDEAYTDPISNLVVLRKMDAVAAVRSFMSGQMPAEFLRVFIHEVTHHVCFSGPVGMAMAALAGSPAGEIGDKTDEQGQRQLRDLVKSYCVMEVFRPLAEGLALFAEFDAFPGFSSVASQPLKTTSLVFSDQRLRETAVAGDVERYWSLVRDFFLNYRLDATLADQKKGLLTSSLFDESGYLLGYLYIKSQHHHLARGSNKLIDTDFFLLLMIDFWFNDYVMANLLLDDTGNVVEDVYRFFVYFEDRSELLAREIAQLATECEHCIEHGLPRSYGGRDQVNDVEFEFNWRLRTMGRFGPFGWDLYARRHVFRFATTRVEVEIDLEGKYVARKRGTREPIASGTALRGGLPAGGGTLSGDGTIELVMLHDEAVVLCVFCGNQLVGAQRIGEDADPKWLESTFGAMLSFAAIEDYLTEIETTCNARSAEWEPTHLDLRNRIRKATRSKFGAMAFTDKDGSYDLKKLALLGDGGLRNILPDSQLLTFAARTSVLANYGFGHSELAEQFSMSSDEFEATLAQVQRTCLNAAGFEPFLVHEGRLFRSRI